MNLNEINVALRNFFEQFTMPNGDRVQAFTGRAVFRDAQGRPTATAPQSFTYIMYPSDVTAWGEQQRVTIDIWGRTPANVGFFGNVNHVTNQIMQAIPHEGATIKLESGIIKIRRQSGFVSDLIDPNDDFIVRKTLQVIYQYFVS